MNTNLKEPIIFDDEYDVSKDIKSVLSDKSLLEDERVGDIVENKKGGTMQVLGYGGYYDTIILFNSKLSTGENKQFVKRGCTYQNFKKGELVSPFDCTFQGVGYLGVGPYDKVTHKKYYSHWTNMLTRCYNPKSLEIRPGYRGCSVDPYFHNFQNFCYWCDNNYYEMPDGEQMCLDKDILQKGNMVYSPFRCIFVPQTINKLFTFNRTSKQIGVPIGCNFRAHINKYEASCSVNKKKVLLGYFYDKNKAFEVYKEVKLKEIKRVADEYRPYIPPLLYDAMINYKLEMYR